MAAVSSTRKIKHAAPKVRNRGRGPGYWRTLAAGRDNRPRELVTRYAHQGINFPELDHVGSAAYRRMRRR